MFALIPLPEPKERAICGRIFPVAATVTRAVDSTSNLKIIQRRTLHPHITVCSEQREEEEEAEEG